MESPIVKTLMNLYGEPNPDGVVYVMYAPPGQGKTFGARALLKNYYEFSQDEYIKGFMLTGQTLDQDYMPQLCERIRASGVNGWMLALLLALNEPMTNRPSILILDGFNSLGQDNINLMFHSAIVWIDESKHACVCCGHDTG